MAFFFSFGIPCMHTTCMHVARFYSIHAWRRKIGRPSAQCSGAARHASMKHSCIPKENSILNRVLIGIVTHRFSGCQRNLCNEARPFEVPVRCFLCFGFGCAPVRALVFNEEFFACFCVFKPPCSCCHFLYLSLHYHYTTFGLFVKSNNHQFFYNDDDDFSYKF